MRPARHPHTSAGARHAGVSLIEVLVALLVVSLGMLGATGLQLAARRGTVDADQRSLAGTLAHDLVERMRANNSAAALAVYASVPVLGRGSMGTGPAAACSSAPCTPAQLAWFDLWHWEQSLDGALETLGPGNEKVGGLIDPTACLSAPPGGGNGVYALTLAWRGSTPLPAAAAEPCGSGTGLYGDDDRFRHLLQVSAWVSLQ